MSAERIERNKEKGRLKLFQTTHILQTCYIQNDGFRDLTCDYRCKVSE